MEEIRMKLEGKLKFIIYQQIFDELEAKRKREPKATKFSRLLDSSLSYLEKNKATFEIDILQDVKKSNELTDEFLLRKSLELKNKGYLIFLATNDSELRRNARISELSTIFLRQKKFLSIERV
jgi:rRNA-processing protein FCF1